jgi:hypothetical protein
LQHHDGAYAVTGTEIGEYHMQMTAFDAEVAEVEVVVELVEGAAT